MGIERNTISAIFLRTLAVLANCRPKLSIIDRRTGKSRYKPLLAASDVMSQRKQWRSHVRSLGDFRSAMNYARSLLLIVVANRLWVQAFNRFVANAPSGNPLFGTPACHAGGCRFEPRPVNTSAFVGTNPTDESIVSGLPVVRQLFGNLMLCTLLTQRLPYFEMSGDSCPLWPRS